MSCLESLVFLWRRRVYGGSCKTSFFRRFPSRLSCRFAWQAYIPTCLITCQMSKLEEVSHKTRDFFGGRGGGPSLLRRGEKRRSAMPRPGGPWPDLSAYARQPARGPTMLAHFVAMLAYVGLSCGQCGPILWLCWPMLASCHVDPC